MRILVISDLHGDLASAREAVERYGPDLLLSCGDWGDPDQVSEADLASFAVRLPVLSTFGNHDPLDALTNVRNRDGSPVLLAQGEVRAVGGVRIAAIGGIWAKTNRLPHYVTDAQVADAADRIARQGPTDILLTHGCPSGHADLTTKGTRGGQRCFLDAFHKVAPRVHLCGHLHVPQERALKDGRKVINVGATPEGSVVVIEDGPDGLAAHLERFSGSAEC
jgi:Icc-related predicted phosphoesterase